MLLRKPCEIAKARMYLALKRKQSPGGATVRKALQMRTAKEHVESGRQRYERQVPALCEHRSSTLITLDIPIVFWSPLR
jgi:hypothetical protein